MPLVGLPPASLTHIRTGLDTHRFGTNSCGSWFLTYDIAYFAHVDLATLTDWFALVR